MNHRYRCQYAGLANLCLKPLGHPSNMIFFKQTIEYTFRPYHAQDGATGGSRQSHYYALSDGEFPVNTG